MISYCVGTTFTHGVEEKSFLGLRRDKTMINYRLFPRGQVFSLGIRLTSFTIHLGANSFKEAFSFLSVFSARHNLGIWVSSVSQIMCLHCPMNKRQLGIFRWLKNYHVLAFWRIFLNIHHGRRFASLR